MYKFYYTNSFVHEIIAKTKQAACFAPTLNKTNQEGYKYCICSFEKGSLGLLAADKLRNIAIFGEEAKFYTALLHYLYYNYKEIDRILLLNLRSNDPIVELIRTVAKLSSVPKLYTASPVDLQVKSKVFLRFLETMTRVALYDTKLEVNNRTSLFKRRSYKLISRSNPHYNFVKERSSCLIETNDSLKELVILGEDLYDIKWTCKYPGQTGLQRARPATSTIPYAGSKRGVLNQLVPLLVNMAKTFNCSTYIEPFLGAGGAFLGALEPLQSAGINNFIVNDINPLCTTALKLLAEEKISEIQLFFTYSRSLSRITPSSPYESIAKAYNRFNGIRNGWCGKLTHIWRSVCYPISMRLLENKYKAANPKLSIHTEDVFKLLTEVPLTNNTLVYLDPPYLDFSTRCREDVYNTSGAASEEFHNQLLNFMHNTKAPVIISSYRNRLYDNSGLYSKSLAYRRCPIRAASKERKEEMVYSNVPLDK